MIELKNVVKSYPNGVHAINNMDLSIDSGEFVYIIGATGSGKSTLVKLLNAEIVPNSGKILVDGIDVGSLKHRKIPAYRRRIGCVFQDYRLLPKLTVYENIAFALEVVGTPRKKIKEKVNEVLDLVDLKDKAHNYPSELSGGQQQRVAIARALVKLPEVLLLDEPLSNLDARLRLQTREEIRRIQKETGITTIFVTHDQDEAMSISDLIVVMKDGEVQQIDAPQKVYDNPANQFVAQFLGTPPINVFEGEVRGGKLYIQDDAVLEAPGVKDQKVVVGIRPEGFILTENGHLHNEMVRPEITGRDVSILSKNPARISDDHMIRSIIDADDWKHVPEGHTVRFDLKPHKVFLFQPESGERIRTDLKKLPDEASAPGQE